MEIKGEINKTSKSQRPKRLFPDVHPMLASLTTWCKKVHQNKIYIPMKFKLPRIFENIFSSSKRSELLKSKAVKKMLDSRPAKDGLRRNTAVIYSPLI